jgi:phosphoglycerate dehydrogenase-like enzyme
VLHGKTLGIVGLGHVGRAVAQLAAAFGMRVVAWGPSLTREAASAAGCEYLALDDLLGQADVVSVHATLSAASRGLLDAARLARMQPTAYLINTARGPVVDEAALIEALQSGRLAGAALDVFNTEPLPTDHPLRRLDNVVLSPHVGWPTDEAYAGFADAAADVLIAYMEGREFPRFNYDAGHA